MAGWNLKFGESIDDNQKDLIIRRVSIECKRCVIGALYEDFEGTLYSFVLIDNRMQTKWPDRCCMV